MPGQSPESAWQRHECCLAIRKRRQLICSSAVPCQPPAHHRNPQPQVAGVQKTSTSWPVVIHSPPHADNTGTHEDSGPDARVPPSENMHP